jgi:hypothetical protein
MIFSKSNSVSPISRTVRYGVFLFAGSIVILTGYASFFYQGNVLVFLGFSLLSNVLLYRGVCKSSIYFDTFIGVFFWLGFWLKLAIRVAFSSGVFHEPVGVFDGSAQAFDEALLVASCGCVALLFSSVLRQQFFSYPFDTVVCARSGLFQLYRSHRRLLIMLFLGVVLFVAVSNVWLGIYQRGMVVKTLLPYGINGVYKWMLQFGLASVSALILRFEIELNKDLTVTALFIPILESFLSNVSLLSRGMILNTSAFIFGCVRLQQCIKRQFNPLTIAIGSIVFVVLFATSVLAVNYFRSVTLIEQKTVNTATGTKTVESVSGLDVAQRMAVPLFVDRWVGIEGVMAVSSSDKLGWELWKEAWKEEFREGQLSFYDRIFIDSPYQDPSIDKSVYHFVSLPGIVAFLFYPGSLTFLFLGLVACSLIAATIEIVSYRYCGENLLLCSLFAQVIAFRFSSFGYVPGQSYLLIGSLILNAGIIFLADRFLLRFFYGRR